MSCALKMNRRIRLSVIAAAILLLFSSIASKASIQQSPTDQTNLSRLSPDAQRISGSVFLNSFTALDTAEKTLGHLDSRTIVIASVDGRRFRISPPLGVHAAAQSIIVSNSSASMSRSEEQIQGATVTTTIGKVRGVRVAYQAFEVKIGLPKNVDRDLHDYDVLIYTEGDHYFVGFHHRHLPGPFGWAGCYDGVGYNAGYEVNIATLAVTDYTRC